LVVETQQEPKPMKRSLILVAAAALLAASGWTREAAAHCFARARIAANFQSQMYPWHGSYYDTAWGVPVAVVVPPSAENQTHLGWGVGATRITPIQHQFQRNYPGASEYNRGFFQPTPRWPSSTDQFGDYYIRGPW
jgi:hypothetical protein